jgi:hypothetical protein
VVSFFVSETVRFFLASLCRFLARVACVQRYADAWEGMVAVFVCVSPRVALACSTCTVPHCAAAAAVSCRAAGVSSSSAAVSNSGKYNSH